MSQPDKFNRRRFLKTTAMAAAGLSLTRSTVNPAAAKPVPREQPHIIYIMTDQHRGDCLGCAGNRVIKTPNIDSIAQAGVCFTNGYTSVPSCTPARAGLLTGLSPWHHGMLGYGRVAEKYPFEMPGMLRAAGYYTFGIGKMHWFPQKSLHGFHGTLVDESGRVETPDFVSDYRDWFKLNAPGLNPDATGILWNAHRAGVYALDETLHPTYWTGQTAVELIQNFQLDQPLFLKVSFARPHSPYDPPQRFLDLYSEAEMPEPAVGDWAAPFADFPMTDEAAFGNFGVDHAKQARRAYYANISFIDEQVGQILNALKNRGMYDNALIVFTADHGDMLGDHHHWRKTYVYEGSSKIPYLLKWPATMNSHIPRGAKLAQPVELRDFLPTFLAAARAPIPGELDGRNLLNLVQDENPAWREFIDLEHATCYRDENYWAALTDGKIKYIFHFFDGSEQLFDLTLDPHELTDLAQKETGTLKLWRERLVAHLAERGEAFVKNGKLQIRKEPLLYSPNYPKSQK